MSQPDPKPATRSGANLPEETKHLNRGEKRALDISGDIEHVDGEQKERLNEEAEQLGGAPDQSGAKD